MKDFEEYGNNPIQELRDYWKKLIEDDGQPFDDKDRKAISLLRILMEDDSKDFEPYRLFLTEGKSLLDHAYQSIMLSQPKEQE